MKGQVVGGELGKVCIRQKSDQPMEIGELLISEDKEQERKILLQVYDLTYGSQISQQNLELISGMKLEDGTDVSFFDENVRNYTLAFSKPIAMILGKDMQLCKRLPRFFSELRGVREDDLDFMVAPPDPLFLGKLRSGSKTLKVPISLPGSKVFPHHILIAATTGRGKSNLVKVMLWSLMESAYCGAVVLDPHDEYYGRNGRGLKDHPKKENMAYYTPRNPPPGARTLKINIKQVRPEHFRGAVSFSDAQIQAMNAYYRKYGKRWVESVLLEKPLDVDFHEATVGVLRRRLLQLLDITVDSGQVYCKGVFDYAAGESTIKDMAGEVEQGKTVIVDTSGFGGTVEIMIGSMVITEVFRRYKRYKRSGTLESKPVVSVVLEEAPRVLGKEVLESGPNIFSTIAREGRKFKVGLCAITQLPSLIPREVLANMNTKIVLGMEMKPERQAIIESASQDLSTDDRSIASLDKGEAIVTSNFVKFATPVKVPLFSQFIESTQHTQHPQHTQHTQNIQVAQSIQSSEKSQKNNKERNIPSFEGVNTL